MKHYLFEPRDPLVLRDGRSSENAMRTLHFPWPSSVAGMVRTRIGQNENGAWTLNQAESAKLLEVVVGGPWLVELHPDGRMTRFFPTPVAAVWYRLSAKDAPSPYRLSPKVIAPGEQANLPDGLALLQPVEELPEGKSEIPPAFLSETAMKDWLMSQSGAGNAPEHLSNLLLETRIHVKIDAQSQSAEDGALFSSDGLVFSLWEDGASGPRRFALEFFTDDDRLFKRLGVAHLGGEKRFGSIRDISAVAFPRAPSISAPATRLRLVLVTPGIFGQGYRPDDSVFNGQAKIVAAAVGRPQHISGWDYAARGPKESRRMAPAGSVYWVELNSGVNAAEFAKEWWMKSLCDNEQDRRDGFGLCMLGVS